PDVTEIFFRIVARGRAADEEFAAALQAAQRREPGVAAGEIDHHLDAALISAPLRLAVLLHRPFREVELGVIDNFVGADLFQLRHLLVAARAGDHFRAQKLTQDDAARADAA